MKEAAKHELKTLIAIHQQHVEATEVAAEQEASPGGCIADLMEIVGQIGGKAIAKGVPH